MNQSADFFIRSAVTETTRSYMGGLMTFLVTSAETDNRLMLLEVRTVPGAEPPPHLHYDQDEVFYILEGEIEVYCMGQVRIAQPGGLDGYFEAMSNPATSMEIPATATTYAESDPADAIALAAK